VKMRQHHIICGQHGVEEERHWWDHPRHQEAEEDPCIPASRPTASLAWARMVGLRSFDPSATYPASYWSPCPLPWAAKGRKGSREREPSVLPFLDLDLDLDLLGAMAQQGARDRGTSEECGKEEGRRGDVLAAKGLRLLPKTHYGS
jgi:hypothetical protein